MERRDLLIGIGTVGITTVAGCSGSDDNGTNTDGGNGGTNTDGGNGGTNTNGGNGGSENIHEVGETFTVGSGDRQIEYTVDAMTAVEEVGGEYLAEEASGRFIVVEMTLQNQTDESFSVSSDNYAIVDENDNVYEPSTDAAVSYDSDERFDTESILFEQINPNLSIEGAVIVDIPANTAFAFRIEPAGFLSSAETHFVSPPG